MSSANSVFVLTGKRVFVAGHRGMVGSALVRKLQSEGAIILTATRQEADLTNQAAVNHWMNANKPEVVFLAAAKVGGILANATRPAEFLYENMMIEANVIHAAYQSGVQKLVFLGSTCIYPKLAPQPILEEALLTGPLEPTNEWYAIAKIAGIKLCQAYRQQYGSDFISAQPTNLYGPGDNYDLNSSHVLPALLRKAHTAKTIGATEMVVWGTGTPLREFMHVDDLADAAVFLAKNYSGAIPTNLGSGQEISIGNLARLICDVVGFQGELVFDTCKPDGTPRKRADTTKLKALGWDKARTIEAGVREVYAAALADDIFSSTA
jgi:GDP-L-fucose synthase